MEHHRPLDVAGFGDIGLDADAVIADGAIDVGARGDEISELAAEAEAERADLALAFGARAQHFQRVSGVLDRLVGVEALVVSRTPC